MPTARPQSFAPQMPQTTEEQEVTMHPPGQTSFVDAPESKEREPQTSQDGENVKCPNCNYTVSSGFCPSHCCWLCSETPGSHGPQCERRVHRFTQNSADEESLIL